MKVKVSTKLVIVILLLILCSPLCFRSEAGVKITTANFPDPDFFEFVKQFDTGDKYVDGVRIGKDDGILDDIELSWVTGMNAPGRSLKGIEYFYNLDTLGCRYNGLSELDVSKLSRLKLLNCDGNKLTSLNVSSNSQLEHLHCLDNRLTALNVSSNPRLNNLMCSGNSISSLNVAGNPMLAILVCDDNELSSLNLSSNQSLQELHCMNNKIQELNLSGNHALNFLLCDNNSLTELDLSSNHALSEVHCFFQKRKGLQVRETEDGYEVDMSKYVKNLENIDYGLIFANDKSIQALSFDVKTGIALFSRYPKNVFYY